MHALYEPAADDEENAYNVTITEDMSPDDVIDKVLEVISLSEKKETPCKNGYWYNNNQKSFLSKIDGEKIKVSNMVSLDFPGIKPMIEGTLSYGDFGPADSKIVADTGVQNYNVHVDYGFFKGSGVLNEEGTRMAFTGMLPGMEFSMW